MITETLGVVRTAIHGWQPTLRLCLIIVVAATIALYFYLMGVPVLPGVMR